MNTTNTISITRKKLSVKTQTIATICSIVASVTFPYILHTLGALSGLENSLGEIFLPMHLPIILTGLLAGSYAGAISGAISPIISYFLSGMPKAAMLPFMMIELLFYGLFAGLMKNAKISSPIKVITVQIMGRLMRAIALILAIYVFGYTKVNIAIIWSSIPKGLFGIILQLVLIPLTIYRIKDFSDNEE